MIIGIGTDILDVRRISKILNKYDQSFINRIYGSNEIKILKNKSKSINLFLGKRFVAKEATWKAISPNRGDGLVFKEIETLNDIDGKPYLYFSGTTKNYIKQREKSSKCKFNFNISISDEPPYVIAFVIISLAHFV